MTASFAPDVVRKGIRLFAGDGFVLARKYGVSVDKLVAALQSAPLEFTVTGGSRLEGGDEPFVRLQFRCPAGVFVKTHREIDEGQPVHHLQTGNHHKLNLSRHTGESIVLRPRPGMETLAAHDLIHNGPIIEAWENAEGAFDGAMLRIVAANCWQILLGELGGGAAAVPPEASRERYLMAFHAAAERLLSDTDLEQVQTLAAQLLRR